MVFSNYCASMEYYGTVLTCFFHYFLIISETAEITAKWDLFETDCCLSLSRVVLQELGRISSVTLHCNSKFALHLFSIHKSNAHFSMHSNQIKCRIFTAFIIFRFSVSLLLITNINRTNLVICCTFY